MMAFECARGNMLGVDMSFEASAVRKRAWEFAILLVAY
jgi:hypothetical protein